MVARAFRKIFIGISLAIFTILSSLALSAGHISGKRERTVAIQLTSKSG